MSSIDRLGELYGLNAATLAGLANASGSGQYVRAPMIGPPNDPRPMIGPANDPPPPPLERIEPPSGPNWREEAAAKPGAPAPNDMSYLGGGQTSQGQAIPTPPAPGKTPEQAAQEEADRAGYAAAATGIQGGGPPMMVGGGAGQVVPAHWQPGSHEVAIQRGIDPSALAPGLMARGQGLQAGEAANIQRLEAAQLNQAADVEAGKRAALQAHVAKTQLEALDARKATYIRDEHAKLEALNTQAQRKIDTDEAFVGGQAGRIGAAIMVGLGQFASMWKGGTNAALQIVNDGINRTIEVQKAQASNARAAYGDRMNLYRDNMQAFGEQRGELATRIQLLDKVAALADSKRAGAKSLENDAAYNEFMAGLQDKKAKALDEFGEKTTDHIGEKMNEHYQAAQMLGGAGSPKREGNLVTLSDGTTFVMPSEKTANEAITKIQNLDTLQRRNNQILQLRGETAKLDPILDRTAYNTNIKQLKELADEKVALMSIGLGQGTVKEDEYKRAKEFAANAENGLGFFKGNPYAASERESADAVLRMQTKKWADDQRAHVTAAGGSVYERGYAADPSGRLKPVGQYTGQDAAPVEHLAPNGSRAIDGRTKLPMPGPKTSTTIPQAPRMAPTYAAPQPPKKKP